MTTFQKGDRVVRTGCDFGDIREGAEYTVRSQAGRTLYLEGLAPGYIASKFALVQPPKQVHPFPAKASSPTLSPDAETEGYAPNIGHASDGGGIQKHSIGGPFPFVVVGIDNPTGLKPGLYWYVQDKTGRRCTAHLQDSQRILDAAEQLVTDYPNGISPHATPSLESSDGYIPPAPPVQPTITVELTAGEHDFLRALLSHATTGSAELRELLTKFGGYDRAVTARFETTFSAYGGEFAGSGPRGSIRLVRKD